MNYRRTYFNLIRKRKKNIFDGYTEKHHIIPKSLGGKNKKENIINLSAREHFIAHLLLMKMFSNKIKKAKMSLAVVMMLMCGSNQQRYYMNSKRYEKIRKLISISNSIMQKGEFNSQYGTVWITNGKENKKIKSILDIPTGWSFGRFVESDKKKEQKIKENIEKRELKIKEKQKYYSDLYLIYDEKGWSEIKNIYKYSKQNFVGNCKRYVQMFKPQNGKKRGK